MLVCIIHIYASSISKAVKSLHVSKRSFPVMWLNLTSVTVANSSEHLMIVDLSVWVMQVTMSFVIPFLSLFLNFLVIVNQLNLFVNLTDANEKCPRERFVNKNSSR